MPSFASAAGHLAGGAGKLNLGMEMLTGQVSMNHRFVVRIDRSAYDLGTWQTASGLSVKWAKCEYRPGDQGNSVWIWPGGTTYTNIKLARAACSDSAIVQEWLAKNSTEPAPLSGAIQLMDWLGFKVVEWTLRCFFPVGWDITGFNAADGKPAIESLELAHTGFLSDATT
jgi:phage tail-like protein